MLSGDVKTEPQNEQEFGEEKFTAAHDDLSLPERMDYRMVLWQVNSRPKKTRNRAYDASNRRTEMAAYGKGTFTYSYDAANRKIAAIDALGYATTTVYDKANRPIAVTDPPAAHHHHRV